MGKVPRKVLQENPRQNPPKFLQQKSPTHFCRGAGPKKRHGNGNVQANVRANNSRQFEGTAHENVGFRGKKGQKVHPNFAPNITMEFHYHAFCAPDLGFCRKVLRNVSQSKELVEERFCRTPKVLQNFGSQTQLFRPCKISPRNGSLLKMPMKSQAIYKHEASLT